MAEDRESYRVLLHVRTYVRSFCFCCFWWLLFPCVSSARLGFHSGSLDYSSILWSTVYKVLIDEMMGKIARRGVVCEPVFLWEVDGTYM